MGRSQRGTQPPEFLSASALDLFTFPPFFTHFTFPLDPITTPKTFIFTHSTHIFTSYNLFGTLILVRKRRKKLLRMADTAAPADAMVVSPADTQAEKARKQVEFYFADANLPYDKCATASLGPTHSNRSTGSSGLFIPKHLNTGSPLLPSPPSSA